MPAEPPAGIPDAGVPPEPPDEGIPDAGVPAEPDEGIPAEPEGPTEDSYDPLRDSPEAVRARHWVVSGVVLSAVGVVLGIGAIVMTTTDPCDLPAGNGCQQDARTRASLTMGIPAAALLVGGAVALGVGISKRRRLRADVAAGRQGASVGFSVRF